MWRWFTFSMALASAAVAQDSLEARIAAAQDTLSAANAAMQAASGVADPTQLLVNALRQYEDGIIVAQLNAQEAAARAADQARAYEASHAERARLMTALQTLSRTPPKNVRAHPDGVLSGVRSGMLIEAVIPALDAEVAALRADLADVTAARAIHNATAADLQDAVTNAAQARDALRVAMQNRPAPATRFAADQVDIALLIAASTTLGDFTKRLAALYGAGLPSDAALAAKGALPLPVIGRVMQDAAPPNTGGDTAPGLMIATPPHALVVSPTPATVLYAGQIFDETKFVILEPTSGTQFVFAGLAEVFGTAGDIIDGGTPIGFMGGSDEKLTNFEDTNSGSASQALYLEVREMHTPVTPDAWFMREQ